MGGKPVWIVGPACSIATKDEYEPGDKVNKRFPSNIDDLSAWLDVHPPGSALPTIGFNVTEEFKAEWLADGFEDQVKKSNQGILYWKAGVMGFRPAIGWREVLQLPPAGKGSKGRSMKFKRKWKMQSWKRRISRDRLLRPWMNSSLEHRFGQRKSIRSLQRK
ncbi:hypothetical protein REPUB_Repub01dG0235200 [Reevesia pubescens]